MQVTQFDFFKNKCFGLFDQQNLDAFFPPHKFYLWAQCGILKRRESRRGKVGHQAVRLEIVPLGLHRVRTWR